MRSGGVGATTLNITGQRLDGTGLLDYHARYYDPSLSRFVSADRVVPGSASGAGAATLGLDTSAQLTPLAVDFHETGFVSTVNSENAFRTTKGFWFQLSDDDKQEAKSPWGPANPQALNRYSYMLNNPLRYTDPSGHFGATVTPFGIIYHMTNDEACSVFNLLGTIGTSVVTGMGGWASGGIPYVIARVQNALAQYGIPGMIVATMITNALEMFGDITLAISLITGLSAGMAGFAWLYGNKGLDMYIGLFGALPLPPTVARQHSLWFNNTKICNCEAPMLSEKLWHIVDEWQKAHA